MGCSSQKGSAQRSGSLQAEEKPLRLDEKVALGHEAWIPPEGLFYHRANESPKPHHGLLPATLNTTPILLSSLQNGKTSCECLLSTAAMRSHHELGRVLHEFDQD